MIRTSSIVGTSAGLLLAWDMAISRTQCPWITGEALPFAREVWAAGLQLRTATE